MVDALKSKKPIPSASQQTELGILPSDWIIRSIGEIASVGRGRVISHREIAKARGPRYPVFSSQTTNQGVMGYLDTFDFDGDYITWTTDGANAGTVFRRTGRFNCTNVCGTIQTPNDDPRYVAYVLGGIVPRHVSKHLGNPKLMNDVMKRVRIPLPPTRLEQRAIAAALSDADMLIEELERLIAKKRAIKQGAMQELLSGRRRLPGFTPTSLVETSVGLLPNDWLVTRLGSIAEIKTGPFGSVLHERDYVDSGTPIITVEHLGDLGITTQNLPMVSEKDRNRLSAYSLRRGDIVFSRVGSIDRNALVSSSEEGWLFSGRLLRVRLPNSGICSRYLSHHFHSEPFKDRVRAVAVGQTMASLNTKILAGVLVVLPSEIEQVAIADVIDDLNAELLVVEDKLSKARALKLGMMQELLTGRVRLV